MCMWRAAERIKKSLENGVWECAETKGLPVSHGGGGGAAKVLGGPLVTTVVVNTIGHGPYIFALAV